MRTTLSVTILSGALVLGHVASASYVPSNSDLWDISRGTLIVANTPMRPGSDPRDMFGGNFTTIPTENGRTLFSDSQAAGFVHSIEWSTLTPVTIGSFSLFAAGDGPAFNNEREFAHFNLWAKSTPSSSTYDLLLYSYDPTHPYTFIDASNFALLVQNITPVTAQFFKAEFTQFTGGRGFDGPRIMELDGFAVPEPGTASLFIAGMCVACWRFRSRPKN